MSNANELAASLRGALEDGSLVVGVIGLGYVGLPLALAFVERGIRVIGFDVDQRKIAAIEAGSDYIRHIGDGRVASAHATGRFAATTDFARLGEPDVLIACVPTPLDAHRDPDMSFVVSTSKAVAAQLRRGQLVILESTTYPGTTDELVRGILEAGGLVAGADFFLAYSPEREDPGNHSYSTTTIPKLVGGVDPVSGDLAEALYSKVIEKVVRVRDARVAEAAKLTENVFRAINIALVNELKIVYDKMGIDVWEVLDAAATKPFGFMRFNPGPGWGGHCIPLDPFYLSWKAREHGATARFIELAGEINVLMPEYVIGKVSLGLNDQRKSVRGSRVLILGIAYKKDIDDPRESPAFEVLEKLLHFGAEVSYHDPHIASAPRMRSWPDLPAMNSVALDAATIAAFDVVLVLTDHTNVDYALVREHAKLVVDTRGVYREPFPTLVKA
jgi:UDP-N-acetyl-D-glucosamine dehydrogenase